MNANNILDCEDVGIARREGRPLRPARAYRILYAQDNLDFHAVELSNPTPLGLQILKAAGAKPVEDFSLLAILPDGEFEEVPLHETFDLRKRVIERFVGFDTDRLYKLTLDGRQLEFIDRFWR